MNMTKIIIRPKSQCTDTQVHTHAGSQRKVNYILQRNVVEAIYIDYGTKERGEEGARAYSLHSIFTLHTSIIYVCIATPTAF